MSSLSISEPPAILRVSARPEKIEHTSPRAFRFLEEVNDPFGGLSHFSYDAKLFAHVVVLDTNPLVTRVTCRAGGIDIAISDVSAAETFLPDTIVAGSSETWVCLNSEGINMPFTKGIISVAGLSVSLRAESASDPSAEEGAATASVTVVRVPGALIAAFSRAISRTEGGNVAVALASVGLALPAGCSPSVAQSILLHLDVEDVPPTHCFEHMTLNFHRTPGPNEAELRRRMQVRDHEGRWWWWGGGHVPVSSHNFYI
jgi:hypothetical protein